MEELRIPMVIRTGDTVSNLLQLVEASGAQIISCEWEVEYRWQQLQTAVEEGKLPPHSHALCAKLRPSTRSPRRSRHRILFRVAVTYAPPSRRFSLHILVKTYGE